MWWQYLLVFIGSMAVDIVPLPLPPAFTIMVLLQIVYGLNIWAVVVIGVLGSVVGRYILALYVPYITDGLFDPAKNEEVQYLGKQLKKKGWKSQLAILVYSLLPLPTTPIFIAGGMAKIKPYYIIPPFLVGKFASDALAVFMGKFAAENTQELLKGAINWKSISGLTIGVLLICALLFINWRVLLEDKKLRFRFKIWK
jgi:membrane protein DedA with SNARE-associated domain